MSRGHRKRRLSSGRRAVGVWRLLSLWSVFWERGPGLWAEHGLDLCTSQWRRGRRCRRAGWQPLCGCVGHGQQHPCGTSPQVDPRLGGFLGCQVRLLGLVLAEVGKVAAVKRAKEDKPGDRLDSEEKAMDTWSSTSLGIPPTLNLQIRGELTLGPSCVS